MPIHPVHLVIQKDCIALAYRRKRESLRPRGRGENFISRPFEQRLLIVQYRRVVIDAKDGFLGRGIVVIIVASC